MMIVVKKIIITTVLAFLYTVAWSQSYIRPDHYWENPYLVSPAYINNQYIGIISAATRLQWINVAGAPKTIWLTGAYYFEDHRMQIGARILQDKIGYMNTSSISLSYSYAAILDEDWRLDMGLAGSWQSINYDKSQIVADNSTDPSFADDFNNRSKLNADIGLELTSNKFKLGMAGQNLLGLWSGYSGIFPQTWLFYSSYRWFTESMVDYQLGISQYFCGKYTQNELSAMAIFKKNERDNVPSDKFYAGLFYRHRYELGATLGMNISSQVSLCYSYTYNNSAIKYNSIGSHQLILSYRIKPKPPCHCNF
jgi:type IX secretion system PorP/SprF family membrane protein